MLARAQQMAMPVIGLLSPGTPDGSRDIATWIRQGLAESGLVEGRNLVIEYRWAQEHFERLPALADDLVRRRVAAIITVSTTAALAAKAATTSIPIVFAIGSDPVDVGLVTSLNRPGGNLTGLAILSTTVDAKRVELLHELLPVATSIAYFVNSTNRAFAEAETRELQVAARTLGRRLLVVNVSSHSELDAAFETLAREGAGGLVIGGGTVYRDHSDLVVALAARHRIPVIFPWREVAVAGGLMSYGTDLPGSFRKIGSYAARVLKGDKPAELPVEQVTKMELVLNTKTAKALDLAFPTALLVRADEVIE
jgi:putative ABC transport system substrate-binding protein